MVGVKLVDVVLEEFVEVFVLKVDVFVVLVEEVEFWVFFVGLNFRFKLFKKLD